MKKIVTFLFGAIFFGLAMGSYAQTPQEIVDRMEEAMETHEPEGIVMIIDVKVPIVGTMTTKSYSLGDKLRVEAKMLGVELITWSDGTTEWTYNSKSNEVEIDNDSGSAAEDSGDTEMFSGITDGYDLSIQKETADAWYLKCKKSKTNTDKDSPKTIDLVIAKGTYYPISLSTKVSGVSMTMREISFGVPESMVTFNINDYPDAKVVDKRNAQK